MKKVWALLIMFACILQTSCAKMPEATGDNHKLQSGSLPFYGTPDDPGDSLWPEYPDETVWQEWPTSGDTVVIPEETQPDDYDIYDETIPDESGSSNAGTEPVKPTPVPTTPPNPAQPTEPQQPTVQPVIPVKTDVAEPLTWEKINAIPVANSGMSEAQLRKICTDFMRLQLSFPWTPSKNLSYAVANNQVSLNAGSVYGGLPYVSSTFGNLYKAMEYYDEKTGVLDTSDPNVLKIIGNQCSASAYWAWSRVSNGISFGGTQNMLEKYGCLRLGKYTYSGSISNFHSQSIRTANICAQNGAQTMYEAYALLLPADGLSMYTGTAGHVRMVAEAAHVVRNSNGTINPERSSITFLDQVSNWSYGTQVNGKSIKIQGGVDVTVSFRALYQAGYLPFRIPEFAGKKSVEKGQLTASISGSQVKVSALSGVTVSANYPLSDITVLVLDSDGKTAYRNTQHINDLNIRSCSISSAVKKSAISTFADGKHTVQISCRIGTGEKLVAYTGKLIK